MTCSINMDDLKQCPRHLNGYQNNVFSGNESNIKHCAYRCPDIVNEITLRLLTPNDVDVLKGLCSDWFPIKYPDTWFNLITSDKKFFSLSAIINGNIVAVLVAEIKPRWQVQKEDSDLLASSFSTTTMVAYLLSLGVHRQYRRHGIASFLFHNFLLHLSNLTYENGTVVKAIYLHVLCSNSAAINFYEKLGFQVLHFLPSYYVINEVQKDGFSYVYYLNDGKPQLKCYDYVYKVLKDFLCMPLRRLPIAILSKTNIFVRHCFSWLRILPFLTNNNGRQCHTL